MKFRIEGDLGEGEGFDMDTETLRIEVEGKLWSMVLGESDDILITREN